MKAKTIAVIGGAAALVGAAVQPTGAEWKCYPGYCSNTVFTVCIGGEKVTLEADQFSFERADVAARQCQANPTCTRDPVLVYPKDEIKLFGYPATLQEGLHQIYFTGNTMLASTGEGEQVAQPAKVNVVVPSKKDKKDRI